MLQTIVEQLVQYGNIKRGHLGIRVQNVSYELSDVFSIPNGHGALITEVRPGTPAHKAGLQAGDVITKINNRTIKNGDHVKNVVAQIRLGNTLTVDYIRDGQRESKRLLLEESIVSAWTIEGKFPVLEGAYFDNSDTGLKKSSGIELVYVEKQSPAWRAGLRQGDIITSINMRRVDNLKMFSRVLSRTPRGKLLVHIYRGQYTFYLVLNKA